MDAFLGDSSEEEELAAIDAAAEGRDPGGGAHLPAVGGAGLPAGDINGLLRPRPRRQLPQVPVSPLSLNWLDLSPYGFPESVALSELPGSKFRGRYRDLSADITTIRGLDITDVVCLLTEPEFRKFRVPNLLSDYEAVGLVVYHFPIEDGKIPENVGAFSRLLVKIRKRIADGYRVLVHCFGGLGRAVLVGACLALSLDESLSAEDVITQMRELRGPRAVQSVKQFNFLYEYRELCAIEEEEGCVSR